MASHTFPFSLFSVESCWELMYHSHAVYWVDFVNMAVWGETEKYVKNHSSIRSGWSSMDIHETVFTRVRSLACPCEKIHLHRGLLFVQICRRKCTLLFDASATCFVVVVHLV